MKPASLAVAVLGFLTTLGGVQQPPPSKQNPPQSPVAAQESPPTPRSATPRQHDELRADILVARKQYAEAVESYQRLLKQEPNNTLLLNKLGIAYHQQALLKEAKRYYERALKADKTNAHALNNIGTVHYQRKKYGKAVGFYKRSLALRPDIATVHSNLGYAYFAQKKYEEAMQAFHRALELDPQVFERNRSGAGVLLQDRSVADRGAFYFFLAKSFAAIGNAERCAHYLRKAWDEGYKAVGSAQTDPTFASVLKDPAVADVLQLASRPAEPVSSKPKPPGP